MSCKEKTEKSSQKRLPFYQTVDGFCIPGFFSPEAFRSALVYKPRPDDLFIVSYPKCGTTWMQHIVACIFKNGKPFESALEFVAQSPFLQLIGAEAASTMKRPGAMKFHLPFNLMPWSAEAKYIFVSRNPKDCCVSFYHQTENTPGYGFEGSFADFFELFIEGEVEFGDYFETTMSWYEHRNDPNVLFITYEELKKDTVTNVLKIAGFMGEKYRVALENDKNFLDDVIHHSSFPFMKEHLNKQIAEVQNQSEIIKNNQDIPPGIRHLFGGEPVYKQNPSDITFVRKGIVGDWKIYFTPEQNSRLEKKFKEKMGNTELAKLWKDII